MIIGLTGGIASGKSAVSSWLRAHGVPVADADAAARAVVAPGTVLLQQIGKELGADLIAPDGTLDRPATARRIFDDPEARRRLNALMHPAIWKYLQAESDAAGARGESLIVWDVPLLVDIGWQDKVDAVWVVRARPERQIERLQARDGLTPEAARLRLAAQIDASRREAAADELIDNNGSLEQLYAQVEALVKTYREKAREQTKRT